MSARITNKQRALNALRGVPGQIDLAFSEARKALWEDSEDGHVRMRRPLRMMNEVSKAMINLLQRGIIVRHSIGLAGDVISLTVHYRPLTDGHGIAVAERAYDTYVDCFVGSQ